MALLMRVRSLESTEKHIVSTQDMLTEPVTFNHWLVFKVSPAYSYITGLGESQVRCCLWQSQWWPLVGARQMPPGLFDWRGWGELEPHGGYCSGCWEVWGGRDFVGKHKCKLFLGFISLSPTSSLLKHSAIKRVWSGLFSALSLHPELH